MLVRFKKTKGSDAESVINPPANKKATMVFRLSFKRRIFANKIGVKISAAPSFAKSAETKLPKRSE